MYVTEIIPDTNTVVLGHESDLVRNGMMVGKINAMKYESIPEGMEAVTKIRYRDNGTMSSLHNRGEQVYVEFHANVKGVAPGQSAVFYEGDDVVGGGMIFGSFRADEN